MKSLGEIIKKSPEFAKIRYLMFAENVCNTFFDLFPEYKDFIFSIKLEEKILYLYTENITVKTSLKQNTEDIITKINEKYKQKVINQIKLEI
jgi:chromosomal replication initiation ATPase DnaA